MNEFFHYCIDVLEWIGDKTGWGYRLANLYLFVLIHPLLTLAFFLGWKPKTGVMKTIKWSLFGVGILALTLLFGIFFFSEWSMDNRYGVIIY